MRNVREQLEKVISLGRVLSPDILMVLDDITDPGRLADLVASNLGLKVSDAQGILETHDSVTRLQKIHEILSKEIEVLSIQAKIRSQAKDEMTKSQKEYFLREQIRAIKNELGDNDQKGEELAELKDKIAACKMPIEVEQEALKQLGRLERMHPDASEASMLRTYIDWLVETPWSKHTVDNLDLARAKQILDEDHYNLDKIKERVLEYLAVRKLKDKMKGPILCFAGPPGVGKTSLGRSIARALGREFLRISLGGVKDEAEIRGHRRTYVGALPGRVVQGLKQAGTNNPVFVLDELDKLGSDFRGDPSAALLEVLDPEQNYSFRDHYLNVPFDLSNVMFIATCNMLETIPSALRDRMEVIQLAGYTEEEKYFISKKYLVPKQTNENGLKPAQIEFTDDAIKRDHLEVHPGSGPAQSRAQRRHGLPQDRPPRCRRQERENTDHDRASPQIPGPRAVHARGTAGTRRDRRRHGPGLDFGGRRDPLRRNHDDERQRQPDPHRPARRRHEGVRPRRPRFDPLTRPRLRHRRRCVRHPRHPRALPRGSDPQGRSLGRDHDGLGHDLAPDRRARPQGRGDDRRDHAHRQSAPDRRSQGKSARGYATRHQDDRDS